MVNRGEGLSIATAILALVGIAWLGAVRPLFLVLACAAIVASWLFVFAIRSPRAALTAGIPLLLLGTTDFRARDALEATALAMEPQVILELVVFAILLAVAVRVRPPSWTDRRLPSMPVLSLWAYVLLAMVSTLWSPLPIYALVRACQLAVLLYFAGVVVRELGAAGALNVVLAALTAYVLLFAVIGVAMNWSAVTGGARLNWFSVHPIVAGTYAAAASMLVIARLLFGAARKSLPVVELAVLCSLLGVLLLTQSRGPLFGLIAAAGSVLLLRTVPGNVAAGAIITGLSVAGAIAMNLSGGALSMLLRSSGSRNVVAEFVLRGQSAEEFLTLTGRIELWRHAYAVILDRPLFGHGYQAARIIGLRFAAWAGEAHNAVVQTLLDFGVLGILLLFLPVLWAIGNGFRMGRSEDPRERLILPTVFGLLLFLVVNSVGAASFAGSPGVEALLLFLGIRVLCARPRPLPIR